jgi:hypothetical protein
MLACMNTIDEPTALRNPKASEMPELLAQLIASGLCAAAFARQENLKPQNVYRAMKRAAQAARSRSAFGQVRILDEPRGASEFILDLGRGFKISVPADFNRDHLHRLIATLRSC